MSAPDPAIPNDSIAQAVGCADLFGPFLDELDVMQPETEFWAKVRHCKTPSHLQGMPHRGDGTTTIVWQDGAPVGVSVTFRNDRNHTILVLVDLRPNHGFRAAAAP